MEYTIAALANLAGISTRTLRYYDEIGLLKPSRINESGYRIYESAQCDRLQEILVSRELGLSIQQIKDSLQLDSSLRIDGLKRHLVKLREKRDHLDAVIHTVEQTIIHHERGTPMNDKQKFASLKQKSLDENEANYGQELRTKYGKATVEQANAQFKNIDSATYDRAQRLATEIIETLKLAMEQGDESSAIAQKACAMHHEWLLIYWPKYEKSMHRGLGDLYVQDERFTAYYDQYLPGMAQFLRNAIYIYAK